MQLRPDTLGTVGIEFGPLQCRLNFVPQIAAESDSLRLVERDGRTHLGRRLVVKCDVHGHGYFV